jgi:hypothetical protein
MYDFNFLDNNDFLELLNYITNCDFSINEESIHNDHFTNKKKNKKKIIKCKSDNCNKNARYGCIKRKPITCRLHKTVLYHDVVSKLCKELSCILQPSFGYINSTIQYCKKHSLPGMINLKSKLCKSPVCQTPDCQRLAYYYIPNTKETFCSLHSSTYMIKIKT